MKAEYSPRPQFWSFHTRRNRWACIVAHRRAGKTVACINELLTRALATSKQQARYAYIAPYRSQAKTIAWEYLKRYGNGVIVKANESELYVELPNGARIMLLGADNPDSIRGFYLDGVILDEFADMKPSVWGAIIRPLLADRNGWAVFIGTPKGHNAFYDIHKKAANDNEWFSLVLRASESGLLPEHELQSACKDMTEDQYLQEFECSFEAAILGAVYGKWMAELERAGRLRAGLYDPALPVYTAWDLGYDDATAIWWFQAALNEPRIIRYHEANGEDIAYYCNLIKSLKYNYANKHFVPHDAAHKLFAAGGRSIVMQAQEHGIPMHVIPATSQQNSIEAARKLLESAYFDPEACQDGIEALKQYQFVWDEDKKIFSNKPRHDWSSHACDAFEIIGQVWRNPVELKEKEAPRFLHEMTANELFWPSTKGSRGSRRERI